MRAVCASAGVDQRSTPPSTSASRANLAARPNGVGRAGPPARRSACGGNARGNHGRAAVTTLDLSAQSIGSLQVGDFAGLTGLTTLDLEDNALTTLPAGDEPDDPRPARQYRPLLLALPAQCPLTSLTTLDRTTYTRPAVAAAPTNLIGTFVAGNIELSWTAPGTGATTSYQVLRKAGSDDEEVYVEDSYDPDADVPSTTFTDSGVTEGETYEYRVRALNAGGASLESGAATVVAALVLSGPSAVSHPEESAFRVATTWRPIPVQPFRGQTD